MNVQRHTMIHPRSLSRVVLIIVLAGSLVAAEASGSLLRHGTFAQADAQGRPLGWEAGPGATVEERDGGKVLVLHADRSTASVQQQLDLDPAWGVLRFRYRVRVDAIVPGSEVWHDARIALTFFDAAGQATHAVAGTWRTPTTGWVAASCQVVVPEGAVRLKVAPAIFAASGTLALADLRCELAARRGEGADAELPAGQELTWGREPVEEAGPQRAEVCLNGLWRFQPAVGATARAPRPSGWGWLRVPGSWKASALPGPVPGSGPAWEGFQGDPAAGWYERELAIPAAWTGRMVVLDLRRVSTDAEVLIDERVVGAVSWPGGEVDLTAAVEPGRNHRVRVRVVAVADQAEVTRFMGMGEGQVFTEKAVLATRGLIGDVLLASRPRGALLTGCGIRTTVAPPVGGQPARGDRLSVLVDYRDLPAAATLALTAVVRDQAGAEVRRFAATLPAAAGAGTVEASWAWNDPLLWDLDQPNLYQLDLGLRGPGIDDGWRERFGFRDFRIDGRRFLLNGTELRLRPALVQPERWIAGSSQLMGHALAGLRWAGFNVCEMWPWNRDERGSSEFDELWCAEADRRGFLLLAPALDQAGLVGTWARPGVADGWQARMAPALKRLRNHPSAVMWATGANRFAHGQDQNPAAIGHRGRAWIDDADWRRDAEVGHDIVRRIKAVDPTRPVLMHAGGPVGEVYTANNYLCLTALQEREEWLSQWAADGDMPVMMVEFGTPLSASFHRSRRGYPKAMVSEPLYSEYAAIYLGPEAYRGETPAYRDTLAATYEQGQVWKSWHSVEVTRLHQGFNRLEELFLGNTWRSWRTWGLTGGMLPWSNGHGWLRDESGAMEPLPAFVPGQRGTWQPGAARWLIHYLRPEGMPLTCAGEALVAANRDTLAWIAGAPDFTDKTHHVRAGAVLAKQAALLNDGRRPAPWRLEWSAEVGGQACAQGSAAGVLAPAGTVFVPIAAAIPASLAAERLPGAIRLVCTIAGIRHEDRFAFTAFAPAAATVTAAVALLDPVGDSGRMLAALGIPAAAWDGQPTGRLVVVGRNACAVGGIDPAVLRPHLAAGGRVLLLAQDPAWLQTRLGLRVARHLPRRAFPVLADHPALAGLDAEGFRDWAGSSRLVAASDAPITVLLNAGREPFFGWRWGARHALSSAAIEIPHRAGWRPLLACEFDGAYTPLVEAPASGGLVTVCTLNLEDHVGADPAAERVARAVVAAAAAVARPEPRSPATYLGGDEGAAVLDAAGILHRRAAGLPEQGVAVIGADAALTDPDFNAFLRRGGRALLLPRASASAPLGVRLEWRERHPGSLAVPTWPSCRGLGAGELRRRSDGPVWVIAAGADAVGADGLLAEVRRGSGVAVFCQLDTGLLDAGRLDYLRLTRWRWTRALSQIAGNLGIAGAADDRLLTLAPPPERIPLRGTWKAALTAAWRPAEATARLSADPGPSPRAQALLAAAADETAMQEVPVPSGWESYGGAWADADGEAVFRRTIEIPAAWAGRELVLSLGMLDDFDVTCFDGVQVGSITAATPNAWSTPRRYPIPASLATPGRHVIAIRIFDHHGGGGMYGGGWAIPQDLLFIEPAVPTAPLPPSWYHADYRDDYSLGDDPYRYCRW